MIFINFYNYFLCSLLFLVSSISYAYFQAIPKIFIVPFKQLLYTLAEPAFYHHTSRSHLMAKASRVAL